MTRAPATPSRRIRRRAAEVAAALLVASPAHATFIGVGDGRFISAGCSAVPLQGCNSSGSASPSPPFSPFDQRISRPTFAASQTSSFSADRMLGNGTVSDSETTVGTASHIHSVFTITFDVDVPTPFTLTGALVLPVVSPGSIGYSARATLNLLDSNSTAIISARASEQPCCSGPPADYVVPIAHAGVLDPGRYTLRVEANAGGLSLARATAASWRFDFAAVPEPGTAALVGVGLAWLARRSRRFA